VGPAPGLWARERGVAIDFIDPGNPAQNPVRTRDG
jgi:hypothetical protein